VTPAARRRALVRLRAAHRCSERRACGLVGLARSVARYRSRRRDDAELRARLRELRLVVPERRNQRGSMDFASDALWTGRCFRCLCIVDDATRESPALLSDFSIGGARVVRVLDELAGRHGLPAEIVMDNGPEFTGRAPFAWSARTGGVGCGALADPTGASPARPTRSSSGSGPRA
jgi:hypothetical protein